MNIGSIDTTIFFAINHLPHGWFLDGFFSLISGLGDSGFIWFVIGIWLIAREERKDKQFFLPLGLAGLFTWIFSEFAIKDLVARLRPSTVLDSAVVVGFPNGYSFPSTHTTFAFALAYVLAYKEPKLARWLYGLAVLVGFSRIYLGAHYPFDVLVGALLGWIIGFFVILWYRQYRGKKNVSPVKKHGKKTLKKKQSKRYNR
jgi:undecaprenyl-diphosphatase